MSAMPTPAGVNLSDSRQPELYAATIITYCLALLALGLRFLSRRLLKSGYGLDDYFAVAAMVWLDSRPAVMLDALTRSQAHSNWFHG